MEPQETPAEAALRELEEECCVRGKILRQTAHATDGSGIETITFLMEIGDQEPHLGS